MSSDQPKEGGKDIPTDPPPFAAELLLHVQAFRDKENQVKRSVFALPELREDDHTTALVHTLLYEMVQYMGLSISHSDYPRVNIIGTLPGVKPGIAEYNIPGNIIHLHQSSLLEENLRFQGNKKSVSLWEILGEELMHFLHHYFAKERKHYALPMKGMAYFHHTVAAETFGWMGRKVLWHALEAKQEGNGQFLFESPNAPTFSRERDEAIQRYLEEVRRKSKSFFAVLFRCCDENLLRRLSTGAHIKGYRNGDIHVTTIARNEWGELICASDEQIRTLFTGSKFSGVPAGFRADL